MSTSGAKRPSVYSGGVLIDGRGLPGKRVYSGGVLLDGSAPGNRVYSGGILCENKYVSITHSKISFASIWNGSSGRIFVDWGDGSTLEEFVLIPNPGVIVNHEYSAGTWKIKVFGDLELITDIAANGNNISSINFKHLPNLVRISIYTNNIVDISSLFSIKNLIYMNFAYNDIQDISCLIDKISLDSVQLFGNNVVDVSPLRNSINATFIGCGSNNIDYPSEGIDWPTWDGLTFSLKSNVFNKDEVDQCCIDWDDSGSHDGVYDISGTNAAPTAASAAARTHFVDVLLNTLTVSI